MIDNDIAASVVETGRDLISGEYGAFPIVEFPRTRRIRRLLLGSNFWAREVPIPVSIIMHTILRCQN